MYVRIGSDSSFELVLEFVNMPSSRRTSYGLPSSALTARPVARLVARRIGRGSTLLGGAVVRLHHWCRRSQRQGSRGHARQHTGPLRAPGDTAYELAATGHYQGVTTARIGQHESPPRRGCRRVCGGAGCDSGVCAVLGWLRAAAACLQATGESEKGRIRPGTRERLPWRPRFARPPTRMEPYSPSPLLLRK